MYIDLGKQTITRRLIGSDAEVFLNRKCCADTYFQRRAQHSENIARKERGLRRTIY